MSALVVLLVPLSPSGRLRPPPLREQHGVDDKLALVDSAEIESGTWDQNVLLPREEIELAEHRGSGDVQRAAEGRAICLVRMPGQDRDDLIPVARDDRFQVRGLAHDEHRVVVRWSREATGVVEDDQISPRRRIS